MSLSYSKDLYCKSCDRKNSGIPSWGQQVLFFLGLACAVIPGVIYYYLAKPNRCFICGLRTKHQKD